MTVEEQLAALTERVAFIESACPQCKQKRSDQKLLAQRAEHGRKRQCFLAASPEDRASTLAALDPYGRQQLVQGLGNTDQLTEIARSLSNKARDTFLETLEQTNQGQTAAWIRFALKPCPPIVRVQPPESVRGQIVGTVTYGPKGTHLMSMSSVWTGTEAEWEAILREEQSGGPQHLADRLKQGALMVEQLSETESRKWAFAQGYR